MKILSLRGGGIRGLATASLIHGLEAEIGPCWRNFDLIVGTSTGGILALALGLGIPSWEVMKFYCESGPRIFNRRLLHYFGLTKAKYDGNTLFKEVNQALNMKMIGSAKTRVMVTMTDLQTLRARFVKSWLHPEVLAADAACATSAAPTYFDPWPIQPIGEFSGGVFGDGGLFANNPAMCALMEGNMMATMVDISCPGEHGMKVSTKGGAVHFLPGAFDVMLDAGMDAVSEMSRRILGDRYLEVLPKLCDASPALDEVSRTNLAALVGAGTRAAQEWVPKNKEIMK